MPQGLRGCLPAWPPINSLVMDLRTHTSIPAIGSTAALCSGLLDLPGSRRGWEDEILFCHRALHICTAPCVFSHLCWECHWAGFPQLGSGKGLGEPKGLGRALLQLGFIAAMPWRLCLAVAHPMPEAKLLPLCCRGRTLAPLTVMVLDRGGMA